MITRARFLTSMAAVLALCLSFTACSSSQGDIVGQVRDIKVYFLSEADLQNATFDHPFEVTRQIGSTEDPIDRSLRQLFFGPTDEEYQQGARTTNDLQAIAPLFQKISRRGEGVIVLHFHPDAFMALNGPAARQLMLKAPIEKTVKQFPEVTEVQYARDEEIFEDWDA